MTSTQTMNIKEIEVIQTHYSKVKGLIAKFPFYKISNKSISMYELNLQKIADNILTNPNDINLAKQKENLKLILHETYETLIIKKVEIVNDIIKLNSHILDKYIPNFYENEYPQFRELKKSFSTIDGNNLDYSLQLIENKYPLLDILEEKLRDCKPLLTRDRQLSNIKDRKGWIIGFLAALIVTLAGLLFNELVLKDKAENKKDVKTEQPVINK